MANQILIRNLPDDLHKKLKIMAIQQGISLNALCIKILEIYTKE